MGIVSYERTSMACRIPIAGAFDFYYVRAEIGQEFGAVRTGNVMSQVQYTDAV